MKGELQDRTLFHTVIRRSMKMGELYVVHFDRSTIRRIDEPQNVAYSDFIYAQHP